MNNKNIEVGIIGAGGIAENMHLPIIANQDDLNISFIFDKKKDRSREVSNLYGGSVVDPSTDVKKLPSCDLVVITVPVGVRNKYIREFGRRGTLIFTEKPFASSIGQHKKFLEYSSKITCNYMRTKFKSVELLKEILESEILGDVKSIILHETKHGHGTSRGKGTYQTNPELSGGGVLVETGSHVLSQLEYILSDFQINVRHSLVEYLTEGLDSHVEASMVARNDGSECEIDLKISSVFPFQTKGVFEFENGKVNFDPTNPDTPIQIKGNSLSSNFHVDYESDLAKTNKQSAYLRLREFLEGVENGRNDPEKYTSFRTTEIISQIKSKSKR